MTADRLPLAGLMAKGGDRDLPRAVSPGAWLAADHGSRRGRRDRRGSRSGRGTGGQTWRNGCRDRTLETRLGPLNLTIPKPRTGSRVPGVLEPGKTVETAPVPVIRGGPGSLA